jgi:hypothetical protein
VSEQILTVLKFFLIALVWLFFLRVLRAVWVEVRSTDETVGAPAPARAAAPAAAAAAAAAAMPAPSPVIEGGRRASHSERSAPGARAEDRRSTRSTPRALTVVDPPEGKGRTFELANDLTLGRDSRCGIALDDDSFVSSTHARLWFTDGRLWVEDLGSTNGTFINSNPVTSATPLSVGDRLQVGRTVLEAAP